jgi:hypothetical protein
LTHYTSGVEVLGANPLLNTSYYTNHTNFGMTTIRFKPEKRLTANVGYSITSVDGSTPQFNYRNLSAHCSTSTSSRWPT